MYRERSRPRNNLVGLGCGLEWVGQMQWCDTDGRARVARYQATDCTIVLVKDKQHHHQLLLRLRRRGGDLLPRARRPADVLRFLAGDLLLRDDCRLDLRDGLLRELRLGDRLRRLSRQHALKRVQHP